MGRNSTRSLPPPSNTPNTNSYSAQPAGWRRCTASARLQQASWWAIKECCRAEERSCAPTGPACIKCLTCRSVPGGARLRGIRTFSTGSKQASARADRRRLNVKVVTAETHTDNEIPADVTATDRLIAFLKRTRLLDRYLATGAGKNMSQAWRMREETKKPHCVSLLPVHPHAELEEYVSEHSHE